MEGKPRTRTRASLHRPNQNHLGRLRSLERRRVTRRRKKKKKVTHTMNLLGMEMTMKMKAMATAILALKV